MTYQPKTFDELDRAGLLGPLARKDAGDTGALAPETKALAEAMQKTIKELRETNDAALKGKADAQTVENMQKGLDALEAKFLDELKTFKATAPTQEIKADERAFALELAAIRGGDVKSLILTGPSKEMVDEAKAYGQAFEKGMRFGEEYLEPAERKALSNAKDPKLGWWVPTTQSARIITKTQEMSPMDQLATTEQVNGDRWEIENDRGYVPARWVDSTTQHLESETPTVGKRFIMVHNMQAQPAAPADLLEDATRDVEGWLANKVAIGFALARSTAFVNGDGVGKPRGFMTYTPVAYDKAGEKTDAQWGKMRFVKSGNASSILSLDPFIDMISGLKRAYRANAAFQCERMSLKALRLIKDTNGRYMLDYNASNRGLGSVFGYDLIDSDDMPTIAANAYPVAFGDWRAAYTIAQRRDIRVLRDPFTAKPRILFDHTARVGGDVVDFDAYLVMKVAA